MYERFCKDTGIECDEDEFYAALEMEIKHLSSPATEDAYLEHGPQAYDTLVQVACFPKLDLTPSMILKHRPSILWANQIPKV